MRLLEVVEGAEEASLDAGHVLLREVGVVLGGGVWAWPQQAAHSAMRRAATMYSKKKCFSNALGYALVVLEVL